MTRPRHEFTAEETADLLAELDARLRQRGVGSSIFVVGGAAIAANHALRERVTEDVDALTRDTVVLETASPEQLEAHIRRYCTDSAALDFTVDGNDVDREISLLAKHASRMLGRISAGDVDATRADSGTARLRRSTDLERRTSPRLRDDPAPRSPDF